MVTLWYHQLDDGEVGPCIIHISVGGFIICLVFVIHLFHIQTSFVQEGKHCYTPVAIYEGYLPRMVVLKV